MIDLLTVLEAVKTQFEADTTLSAYVEKVDFAFDDLEVDTNGMHPSINIMVYDVMTGPPPGQGMRDYVRYTIPLIIGYTTRDKLRKTALYGSTTKKGAWQLFNDIIDAINVDKTFGINGILNNIFHPEYTTDAYKHIDGSEWIGKGLMVYEIYYDEWQR